MEERIQKRRREEKENIASSSMASTSLAKRLKKAFQLVGRMKQSLVEDTRSVKITKEIMNHCLNEILLFIREQSNTLPDIQGKCSAYQDSIKALKEDIPYASTYISIAKSSQCAQVYSTPKRYFLCTEQRDKTSKDIKEKLINKMNPRRVLRILSVLMPQLCLEKF